MKKISNIFAWIIMVMLIINCPLVLAAPNSNTISGQVANPHFKDLPQQTVVYAQTYYATQASTNPTFTSDTAVLGAILRDGLKNRAQSITLHYRADYLFPTDQDGISATAKAITNAIFNEALVETNDPTEGDSLRYCYTGYTIGGSFKSGTDYTNATLIISPTYFTTKAQEDELSAAVNQLVSDFGFSSQTTDREKADTIYGYLTDNITYDYENLEDDSHLLKFSAYAALIHKTAVCEGYAVLFYRLAEACGLDARVITGYGGEEMAEKHAWNIVQMGASYYCLDATWDAERIDYAYYLKGNGDFINHIEDAAFRTAEFCSRYPIADNGKTDVTSGTLTSGAFQYHTSGKRAIIDGYHASESDVTVPSTINGYNVYSISSGVFSYNHTLEKLTLSEGIRHIDVYSIYYCNNLKELHLPSTLRLKSYGSLSYTEVPVDCPSIATLTLAEGSQHLKLIDGVLYTADMKTALYAAPQNGKTEISLCDGVQSIGNSAFADHKTLQSVTMPDTVTEVGYWAFSGCYELKEIELSKNTEWIGQYAFLYTALSHITIPAATTNIMRDAFAECYLKTITVAAGNPVYTVQNGMLIGEGVLHKFALATPQTSVTVPSGVIEISNYAFQKATGLVSVTLPSGLQSIGQMAFNGCSSLWQISLPSSVTTLSEYAFSECDKLLSISIPASVTDIENHLHHPDNKATIYGESGSAVHTYAVNNGHPFKLLNEFQCAAGHQPQQVVSSDTGYTKVYHYACNKCADRTKDFVETHKDISATTVTLEFTTASYTGEPILPRVLSVKDGDKLLVEGVDYTVGEEPGYNIDVGTTGFNIWGIGEYYGSKYVVYTITKASIADAEITIDADNLEYNGEPLRPDVTVTWNGKTLTLYEDYSIQYRNNSAAGQATVIITGNRNFKDSKEKNFTITAHQHVYSDWMPYSENQHYKECACGKGTLYAAHTYDNSCDAVCNDCGAERTVTHQWSDWIHTETHHWKECTRCYTESPAQPHSSSGMASCSEQTVCEICSASFGGFADHDWEYVGNENEHWQACKYCTATGEKTAHSGGSATCTQKAVCDTCNLSYGVLANHKWSLASDDTAHWQDCDNCTATEGYTPHSGGTATCTQRANCTACQTAYGPFAEHKWSLAKDETAHWQDCDNCTATEGYTPHSGGTATCTQRANCTACQTPYGTLAEHKWSLAKDETAHWQDCDNCTATEGYTPHSGGNATCTQRANCTACQTPYGALAEHKWSLKFNQARHWQDCDNCSATKDEAAHSGGTATCKQKPICSVCQVTYGSTAQHKWSTSWTYKGSDGHARTCTVCATRDTLQAHRPSGTDATIAPIVCSDCGYTIKAKLQNPFKDIKPKDFFYTPVLWALDNKITAGVSASSFAPTESCTRAQVVSFLWRAAGSPEPTLTKNPFTDVKAGTFYYKAVLWAVEKGITAGVSPTRFAPNDTCTRGQIVCFLHRFAGKKTENTANPFKDVKKNAFYYDAVLWAVKNGITAGVSPTSFAPTDTCTRGQVVCFLYRYMN